MNRRRLIRRFCNPNGKRRSIYTKAARKYMNLLKDFTALTNAATRDVYNMGKA